MARFCCWRDSSVWENLLEILIGEPDFEWLMIDASHVKVHPDAAGARDGNQAMNQTKEGSIPRYIWPWGNPLRILITEGGTADCTRAHALTDSVNAQYLLADRGYDTNETVEAARRQANMDPVIPLRKNHTVQREYGKYIYRQGIWWRTPF